MLIFRLVSSWLVIVVGWTIYSGLRRKGSHMTSEPNRGHANDHSRSSRRTR